MRKHAVKFWLGSAWSSLVVVSLTAAVTAASSLSYDADGMEIITPARLWVDEMYFSPQETFFMRMEVAKSQRKLTLAGTGLGFLTPKSTSSTDAWDVLHTTRRNCYRVQDTVWPKRVNCIPGSESFTLKKALVNTMQAVYGEQAFRLIPRSYVLPEQYGTWVAWSKATSADPDATWVLKSNIHRGAGVSLIGLSKGQQAVSSSLSALAAHPPKQDEEGRDVIDPDTSPKPFILAQQYIKNQFEFQGRQCYVRTWAVVTSVHPLRLYLYQGGVLIFGDASPGGGAAGGPSSSGDDAGKEAAPNGGRIVNLWQMSRNESLTWTLDELRQHMADMHPAAARGDSSRDTGGVHQSRKLLDDDQDGGGGGGGAGGRRRRRKRRQGSGQGQGRRRGEGAGGRGRSRVSPARTSPVVTPQVQFAAMWHQMTRVVGLAVAAGLPHVTYASKHVSSLNDDVSWDAWSPKYDGSGAFGPLLTDLASTRSRPAASTAADQQGLGGGEQPLSQHTYPDRPAGYEVLGVDWVLNAAYTPHLIEINSLPSMAPKDLCHDREACAQLAAELGSLELAALQTKQDKQLVENYKAGKTRPGAGLSRGGRQVQAADAGGSGGPGNATQPVAGRQVPRLSLVQGGFEVEKHVAVHDLLALLGLPVHPEVFQPEEGSQASQQASAGLPMQWATSRNLKLDRVSSDLGPAVYRGSGVVISLIAALLAESLANATSASSKPGAPVRGNASAVIASLGGWYPAALTAARRALPHLNGVMCAGLPPVVVEPDDALSPARMRSLMEELVIKTGGDGGKGAHSVRQCDQACLWLGELQVLGELEAEWSSKGAFQPLFPVQEAVRMNQQALSQTDGDSAGQSDEGGSSTWAWLKSLVGIKSSRWVTPGAAASTQAFLQLQPSTLDVLTRRAAVVRRKLGGKKEGLLADCTLNPEAAAVCAVALMREVANTKCSG